MSKKGTNEEYVTGIVECAECGCTHIYRWTIKGGVDDLGTIDLVYQEWDEESENWKTRDGLYGIPFGVLKRLVSKIDQERIEGK